MWSVKAWCLELRLPLHLEAAQGSYSSLQPSCHMAAPTHAHSSTQLLCHAVHLTRQALKFLLIAANLLKVTCSAAAVCMPDGHGYRAGATGAP